MRREQWGEDLIKSDRLLDAQFIGIATITDITKQLLYGFECRRSFILSLLNHIFIRTELKSRVDRWSEDLSTHRVGDIFLNFAPVFKVQVSVAAERGVQRNKRVNFDCPIVFGLYRCTKAMCRIMIFSMIDSLR